MRSHNNHNQNSLILLVLSTVSIVVVTVVTTLISAEQQQTIAKTNAGDAIVTVEAPWTQTSILSEAAEAVGEFNDENFWKALEMTSSSNVNVSSQLAEATQVIQMLPVVMSDSEQQRLARAMIASRSYSPSVEAQYQESAALTTAFVNRAIQQLVAARNKKEKFVDDKQKQKFIMEQTKHARKQCGIVEVASSSSSSTSWKVTKPAVIVEYFEEDQNENQLFLKRALICDKQLLENFFRNREGFNAEAGKVLTTRCSKTSLKEFQRTLQVVPFTARAKGDSLVRLFNPSSEKTFPKTTEQQKRKITAVLHGIFGQADTRELHSVLRRVFNEPPVKHELAYFFINQRNNKLPTTPVALQGFGVIMDIKSTEYKVENIVDQEKKKKKYETEDPDFDAEEEEEQQESSKLEKEQEKNAAGGITKSTGPAGLDFAQLRKRYEGKLPGIDTLEQRLLHRYQNRFEPFNESSLTEDQWGQIGLKLISHINKAQAPLSTLTDMLQNFPVRVRRLVKEEVSDDLQQAIFRLHQRFGPGNHHGTTQIALNGRVINAERHMDLFHLQEMISTDEKLLNQLSRVVLPKSFFEPGFGASSTASDGSSSSSSVSPTKLQGDLLSTVTKLRDCSLPPNSQGDLPRFWIEQDEIMWMNDVDKDESYARWGKSLQGLLRPNWGGMPNFVRRNLFHVVTVADPGSSDGISTIGAVIVNGLSQETPMRFGLVLFPDLGEEMNTAADDSTSSASASGNNNKNSRFRVTEDGKIQVDQKSLSDLSAEAAKNNEKDDDNDDSSSSSSSGSSTSIPPKPSQPPTTSAAVSAIIHDFFDRELNTEDNMFQLIRFLHTLAMSGQRRSEDGGQTPSQIDLNLLHALVRQHLTYLVSEGGSGDISSSYWTDKAWQHLVQDRRRLKNLGLSQQQLPATLFNGILFTDNLQSTVFRGFNREFYPIRTLIQQGSLTDEMTDYYNFLHEHHNAIKRFQPEVYSSYSVEGAWHQGVNQEILDSLTWFVSSKFGDDKFSSKQQPADINHIFSGSLRTVDGVKSLRNFFKYASTCGDSCKSTRFALLPVETSTASLVVHAVISQAEKRIENRNERASFVAKFLSRWVDVLEGEDLRLDDRNAEIFGQAAAVACGAGYADIVKDTWQHNAAVDSIVRKTKLLFSTFNSHSFDEPLLHTNGRVTRVSDKSGFSIQDFGLLEAQERSARSTALRECVSEVNFVELSRPAPGQPSKIPNEKASFDFLSNKLFLLGAALSADVSKNGQRHAALHNIHQNQPFCFSAGLGTSRNRIQATFDPFLRDAPKFVSILHFFAGLMDMQVRICLNPPEASQIKKMPIRSFYHYVANGEIRFGADGDSLLAPKAVMRNLNSNTLFTMGVDEPDTWLVFASKAKHDLDNIRFSSIEENDNDDSDVNNNNNDVQKKKTVHATYSLVSLIVSGSCTDDWTRAPPRGLPLVLSPKTVSVNTCGCNKTKSSSSASSSASSITSDTLVMSNLGYFQLKAFTPGVYDLSIKSNSRAEEIYKIENDKDTTQQQQQAFGLFLAKNASDDGENKNKISALKESTTVIVNSFRGSELADFRVSRNAGMETAQLLDEGNSNEQQQNQQQQETEEQRKKKMLKKSFFDSIFSNDDEEKQSSAEQEMLSENQEQEEQESPEVTYTSWPPENIKDRKQPPSRPTLNIFSLASGHLYERLLRLMFFTVVKSSKDQLAANSTRIKFWLIENQMSPRFKKLLPHFAKELGFDYGLVSYKWPYWLRKQSEKQRAVWAYKILFLDVLFPQDVDRVIFVDADQIARADLHELYYMDLQGAPVGFTPFCRKHRREETKGFRFWDSGFWADHLSGKPYHISAIYVVDLKRLRKLGAGDTYRITYERLSADPNSLANLDQDLPNFAQHQIPIFSLPESWLWCETWCDDESKKEAKTIDLCNNPQTKTPKLEAAKRIIPEWEGWDAELTKFEKKVLGE